jgi:uncharacterized protein (DUF58 family)
VSPDRWLPFLAVLFLLGALFQLPFLTSFSAALMVLIGVAELWRRHALDQVVYRRKPYYKRAFPGEKVNLRLEVENNKLLPVSWVRIEDPWPQAVGPVDESILAPSHVPNQGLLTHIFSLRWFERVKRAYTLCFRNRGVYRVGPTRLRSGDLFGMFEQERELNNPAYLTVFPELVTMEELQLPAEDPFGDRKSRRRIFEDPNRPMGVREYRPEDSFRRIHWPATARTGDLQVKVYQPTSAQQMVVCLNVITFPRHWEGVYPPLLERLVSVAATLVYQGVQMGYQVGLISNGCLAYSDQPFRVPPNRSPHQLANLLQTLAAVTPMVTTSFEDFIVQEMPKVHYGASLMIVTAVTSPELSESLIKLKRHGRRVTLLSLAQEPPPMIPDVECVHLPFEEPESEVGQEMP